MNHSSFVYFIEHPDGYYKIGKSNNPIERIEQLSAGSPYSLNIKYLINTNKSGSLEDTLHRRIREYHHKREWFKINETNLLEKTFELLESNYISNLKAEIYGKEICDSLYDPPKPDLVNEGNTIVIDYICTKGKHQSKMATVADTKFRFDAGNISSIELLLKFDKMNDKKLIQKHDSQLKLEQVSDNFMNERQISESVSITGFVKMMQP